MKVDPEFKSLIPPLTTEEFAQLERNILEEGCRDPLVVWKDTMVDGHNRYDICTKRGLPFKKIQKEFESRDKAKEWIILNQFGRRNLTTYDRSLLALKLKVYLRRKQKKI